MGYPAILPEEDESAEDRAGGPGDTVGGRLIRAREARGMTVRQLARRVGVRIETLQNWETDRTAPRSNRLAMLAGILNVSPTWILVGHGEAPLADEEPESDDSPQDLYRLKESIQAKIDELNRIMAEVDDKIEKSAGGR